MGFHISLCNGRNVASFISCRGTRKQGRRRRVSGSIFPAAFEEMGGGGEREKRNLREAVPEEAIRDYTLLLPGLHFKGGRGRKGGESMPGFSLRAAHLPLAKL